MRARNIKPGIFVNEILGQADPIYTLLFEGLWCLADREGRLEDRPMRIKGEVFPYRESLDVNRYLTDLERWGFIIRYTNSGFKGILITNFSKHQSPHHTERQSILPGLPADFKQGCCLTVGSPLSNGGNPPDSLIPDSPIPPLNPPINGGKRRRRSREEIVQGFSEDVKTVVKSLAPIWPTEGTEGDKTSPTSPQDFCQRVSEILDAGNAPDILIQAAKDYIAVPRRKYAAPQFFFGKTGYGGKGEAPWVGFVKFILTKRQHANATP